MALTDFAMKTARPMPVIILADTSGSMGVDGKIDALNQSLRDMARSFADSDRVKAEIHLGIITFGGTASTPVAFEPAHQIGHIDDFIATGGTPMGAAMSLAQGLVEDRELIPSRAYRPVLILASDGYPTDDWRRPFDALINSERASKATRMSLAIGTDADEDMLREFSNDIEAPLFHANDAAAISRFFRAVTMSVSANSRSQNPNQPLRLDYHQSGNTPGDLDLDF